MELLHSFVRARDSRLLPSFCQEFSRQFIRLLWSFF